MLENALESRDKPTGSNEWAVAPSRSASGKAMLANDPHLIHVEPSLCYVMHVKGQELPYHDPRIQHGLGLGYCAFRS